MTNLPNVDLGLLGLLSCVALVFATLAFGQRETVGFLNGVATAIAQMLTAPFAYVRRVVCEVAEPPSQDSAGPHLLLNALLRVAQVVVAGAGLLILAAGTALSVVLSFPDLEARRELTSLEKDLTDKRAGLATVREKVRALDEAFASHREALLASARKAAAQRAQKASGIAVERYNRLTADGLGDYAASIDKILEGDRAGLATRAQDLRKSIEGLDLDASTVERLLAYVAAESESLEAGFATKGGSEAAVRALAQPTYAGLVAEEQSLGAAIAGSETRLRDLKPKARFRPEALGAGLPGSALLFVVFVWIAGVTIESSWLTLRMANDLAFLARRRARPRREDDGTLLRLGAP